MRNQWVHTSAFINMEFNNRNLFQITPDTRPLPPLSCVLSISLDGLKSSTFTTSAPYILTVAPVSFSNTHIPFPYIATYSLLTSLTMSSLNLTVYTDSCLTSSDTRKQEERDYSWPLSTALVWKSGTENGIQPPKLEKRHKNQLWSLKKKKKK